MRLRVKLRRVEGVLLIVLLAANENLLEAIAKVLTKRHVLRLRLLAPRRIPITTANKSKATPK